MRSPFPTCVRAFAAALCVTALSCGGSGLNGPQLAEPAPATGPCFAETLTDGVASGDEILTIFACFNQYGAFDELAPMVRYVVDSDRVDALIDAMNQTTTDFDVIGALDAGQRLLLAEGDPLGRALGLYTAAVDADLLRPALGLGLEATTAMADCEASDDPSTCSVPRLARALLDTDVPDKAGRVLTAVQEGLSEEASDAMLRSTVELLYETSSRNPDRASNRNEIVELGRFLLEDSDGEGAPLDRMLPPLQGLVTPELVEAMAPPLAKLWRDGKLQQLPDDLTWLYTHNSKGQDVGWDGENILDELMGASSGLTADIDLLYEEFTLPGSTTPTTVLELVFETLDSLYLNGADVKELVSEMQSLVDNLCEGSASSTLCDLTSDLLPPLTAAVENTQAVPALVLPLAYTLNHHGDVDQVIDLAGIALELDLLGKTSELGKLGVKGGSLYYAIDLVPVFINTELGTLRPPAEDAVDLLLFFLSPWDPEGDGTEILPIAVPLDLARAALRPDWPNADLDFLLGAATEALLDEESPLSLDNLMGIMDDLSAAMGQQDIDLVETARTVLDNEDLWMAGITLASDPGLIDLLTPLRGRPGAAWYLYDLIDRGVVGRMLALAQRSLELLMDKGFLEEAEE